MRFSPADRGTSTVFLCAFAWALTLGLLVQFLVLPVVLPDLHAGHGLLRGYDYIKLHKIAVVLSDRMALNGLSAWEFRPRTQAVSGIAALLYHFLGQSPAVLLPLNALLFAIAAVLVYRIASMLLADPRGAYLAAGVFIVFPSSMLWYTQIHNDAYFVPGLLLQLWAWTALARRAAPIWLALLAAALGWLLIWTVRDYFLPVLAAGNAAAGLAFLLARRPPHSAATATLVSLALVSGPLLAWQVLPVNDRYFAIREVAKGPKVTTIAAKEAIPALEATEPSPVTALPTTPATVPAVKTIPEKTARIKQARPKSEKDFLKTVGHLIMRSPESLDQIRQNVVLAGIRSKAGSDIRTDVRFRSLGDVIAFAPVALADALLAPYPDMWLGDARKPGGGLMRKIAAMEMIAAYVAFIALGWAAFRRRIDPVGFVPLLAVCLTLLLIWGLVMPNVGTLYRLRMAPWLLLVCLGWGALATMVGDKPRDLLRRIG